VDRCEEPHDETAGGQTKNNFPLEIHTQAALVRFAPPQEQSPAAGKGKL
jgi:hypothetical protein